MKVFILQPKTALLLNPLIHVSHTHFYKLSALSSNCYNKSLKESNDSNCTSLALLGWFGDVCFSCKTMHMATNN